MDKLYNNLFTIISYNYTFYPIVILKYPVTIIIRIFYVVYCDAIDLFGYTRNISSKNTLST